MGASISTVGNVKKTNRLFLFAQLLLSCLLLHCKNQQPFVNLFLPVRYIRNWATITYNKCLNLAMKLNLF